MDPVVFLDRDNTLIENDGDLGDPAQVRLLAGVAEGLRRLKDAGYRLVVVTNQGGVARGHYGEHEVDAVHARIAHLVDEQSGGHRVLDRFYYCPFHPDAPLPEYRREHPWRKPQPGMLLQAATDLSLDLERGWMVGDQARDIHAGRAAGVRTVLVGANGKPAEEAAPDHAATTFAQAVETILKNRNVEPAEAARRAAVRAKSQLELKPPPASRTAGTAVADPRKGGRPRRQRGARTGRAALEPLRRALVELVEEVRSDRTRRGEFGPMRMAAAVAQLATFVLAVFALLELQDLAMFGRWMAGALLGQLLVIALLLFDAR